MKRKNIGRVAGVAVASLALGAMAQSALAAAPACGPGNDAQTFTSNEAKAIPDNDATGVSTSITVSGKTGVLRDVDVKTFIEHNFNRDVSIRLTHGAKTVQLIKASTANRNGSDAFNGILWDDSATKTVSEATKPAPNDLDGTGAVATLVPEGALGAFVGDDPNGVWTLTVTDTDPTIAGSLNGWSLNLATSATPGGVSQAFNGPSLNVPDHTTTGPLTYTRQLTVSGAQPYLTDINLKTEIEHHLFPGELKIWLTSPKGTKVMISNGRGGGSLVSLSTTWDDSATDLITQATWTAQQRRASMVPEGALAAFIGENPNGTWTLTMEDQNQPNVDNPATPDVDESLDLSQYGFDLNSWQLQAKSAAGCDPAAGGGEPSTPDPAPVTPAPVTPAPVSTPTLAAITVPPPPVCVKVGLATKVLGATKIARGNSGVVRVQLKNTGAASASRASAIFAIPSGFSVTKKPAGATIKKGKVTLPFGTIGAGKTKTLPLTLKAGPKASTGLKKSTVSAFAACGSKGSGKLAVTIKKA